MDNNYTGTQGTAEKKSKFKFPGISYNSPVVLTFTAISLLALLLAKITGGASTLLVFSVYRARISPLFFIRLIGHTMGHSGWAHFAGNMMLFLLLGPIMENKYGSARMVVMIAVTAVVTGLFHIIFSPHTMLLGASGIVFMLIILSSVSCVKDKKIPLTVILVVIIYLGAEIVDGLFTKDNVSQLTHVIGGVCGGAFGIIYWKSSDKNTDGR